MNKYKYLITAILSSFLITAQAQQNNGVAFSPLKIDFKSTEQAEQITITNNSNEQKIYQIELFEWKQNEGKDSLKKTKNIIASPLMLKVEPKKKQIVRLGTKDLNLTNQEQSYRIIFNQIPLNHKKGVQVLTNISIPIFIQTKVDSDIKNLNSYIDLKPRSQNGKLINLSINNKFAEHIKIISSKIIQQNKVLNEKKSLHYVLPNNSTDYALNNVPIVKNIPVQIELELEGYENVKKQFIIK